MKKPIKIIDLFAGPGGLGEGFSSLRVNGKNVFNIGISIEKEPSAHRTLTLRAFYRQFPDGKAPYEYYQFLRGELGKTPEEQLYQIPKYQKQVEQAQKEAQCHTLGEDNRTIYKRIREAIGDEECVLIGGPPCQAYSLAGRSRNKGVKGYKAEEDHRNFLYVEYLKVIAKYQPIAFIMENVKGMLSAKINDRSIFIDIKRDLSHPEKSAKSKPVDGRTSHKYKIVSLVMPSLEDDMDPRDFIIRSENYGIPQRRHRVILLGLREDIADSWNNKNLLKIQHTVKLKHVLNDLPPLRSGISKQKDDHDSWIQAVQSSKIIIPSLKISGLIPVAEEVKTALSQNLSFRSSRGHNFCIKKSKGLSKKLDQELASWYFDDRLDNYVCNHETRVHIKSDLYRYLFCSSWGKAAIKNKWEALSPKAYDYPDLLKPKHANFDSGHFADRFRVQVENLPATTITSHMSKDGHYFIHYDPKQCRSLTVREAARIQTFPDNYFFVGSRTQQYVQVGNAVPPYLARQIADIVYGIIKQIKKQHS